MFEGRKLALATMHQKEKVITPILENELKVKIVVPDNFNSDLFGTFTRDIKRIGTQQEAARKKAIAAMDILGYDLGVASEGSFGEDPSIPFVQSNLELVLLIDKKNNLEISGYAHSSKLKMEGLYVNSIDDVMTYAKKWGFPQYGIILRSNKNGKNRIYKDLYTENDLIITAKKLFSRPFTKKIFIEMDMRAHRNPTRMEVIKQATIDLIKNIKSTCPKCATPGFVITSIEKGLICKQCSLPTDLPKYEIYTCVKCKYSQKKLVTQYGKLANPSYCSQCNP